MIHFLLLFTFFLTTLTQGALSNNDILFWSGQLQSLFSDYASTQLGVPFMQNIIDNDVTAFGSPFNGTQMLEELQAELSTLLLGKMQAARNIADAAKAYEPSASGSATEFAYISATNPVQVYDSLDLNYIQGFKTYVDLAKPVLRIPSELNLNRTVVTESLNWMPKLGSTFVSNYDADPDLKWQYFGSQKTGIHSTYPGKLWSRAQNGFKFSSYDPRQRPWYVSATPPGPRNVVIAIDHSGSMSSGTRMQQAKDAAAAVISTLSSEDYFAVIIFDDTVDVLGCEQTTLIRATTVNKQNLTLALENVTDEGGTDFLLPLQKSLELIQATRNDGIGVDCYGTSDKRESLILFLSDGVAEDPRIDLRSQFDSVSTAGNGLVRIFTYSLGSGADSTVLQAIACDFNGVYSAVSDDDDLIEKMTEYFVFLAGAASSSETSNPSGVWSPVYSDDLGLGLMTTAAVPSYVQNKLIGVAGVDVTLEEIDAVVRTYVPAGSDQTQFAFLIDSRGNAVIHPLKKSASSYVNNPTPIDISKLELGIDTATQNDFNTNVRDKMVQGLSGTRTIMMQRRLPAGNSYEGYRTLEVLTTYTFGPIDSSIPFYLCIVLTEAATDVLDEPADSWPNLVAPSIYHRLDIYTNNLNSTYNSGIFAQLKPATDPKYPNTWVSHEKSTIKIAPRGFCDSFSYLAFEDTPSDVMDYHNFFNQSSLDPNVGCTNATGAFDAQLRPMVKITSALESHWYTNSYTPAVWRYAVPIDSSGIIRIYPGTMFRDPTYDPTARPFFARALTFPNRTVFSTPYSDAASGVTVVTLSHTLYQKNTTHTAGDPLSMVLGFDFTYADFDSKVTASTSNCFGGGQCAKSCGDPGVGDTTIHCMTVDPTGFVVSHPSFVDAVGKIDNVYIGDLEPSIARTLLNNNHLVQEQETRYNGKCLEAGSPMLAWDSYFVKTLNPISLVKTVVSVVVSFVSTLATAQNIFPPYILRPPSYKDCIVDVTTWNFDNTTLPVGSVSTYTIADGCTSGKLFVSPIPNSNLYLIVVENYAMDSANSNCKTKKLSQNVIPDVPIACEPETLLASTPHCLPLADKLGTCVAAGVEQYALFVVFALLSILIL